jgi:asparagine synthase (glutamine-hydrolysing)
MLKQGDEINPGRPFIGIWSDEVDDLKLENMYENCDLGRKGVIRGEKWACCVNMKGGGSEGRYEFSNKNKELFSLLFGEIYNFVELCGECKVNEVDREISSPSDLCAILYRRYGFRFASKLNGIFSIVLWDGRDDTLYLYNDRFGSAFPIYYQLSNNLMFSNRLRLLLKHEGTSREVDRIGLSLFLKYSYIPVPRTIIRGINKLGPGEVLLCRNNSFEKFRYCNFEMSNKKIFDISEASERYIEILSRSVRKKMRGFESKRIVFFLSGGLDSSANVALASSFGDKSFRTYGVGFDNPSLDERPYARLVANYFGVAFEDYLFDGTEIEDLPKMVWHLDEPFMENGLFLTYVGFKAAKDNADLIIAGDGADQLFGTGGFAAGRPIALRYILDKLRWRKLLDKSRKFVFRPPYKDNLLFKTKVMVDRAVDFNDWYFWGFDDHELEILFGDSRVAKDRIDCFTNDMNGVPVTFQDYYQYSLVHQDLEHYACQNVLVKSYRMAELCGVNLREAYLDYEVVDFLLSLDISLKTKGNLFDFLKGKRISKYLHRVAMRKLLPDKILRKPKQGGFIPMGLLLRDPKKRKSIFGYLLRAKVLREMLDMGYVKKVIAECENCLGATPYWQPYCENKINQVMNLLVFILWYEIVADNCNMTSPTNGLTQFIK